MNNFFKFIKNYWNKTELSNGDVIITSVVSVFVVFVLAWFFRKPFLGFIKNISNLITKNRLILYFKYQQRLNTNKVSMWDIENIRKKKAAGNKISIKEEKAYIKYESDMEPYRKQMAEMVKNGIAKIPNLMLPDIVTEHLINFKPKKDE